jgi:molecular chaperone IbpA
VQAIRLREPVRPSGEPFCMSLQGGYAMRTFDLSPLYRSTVGFDRLFSMLDQASGFEGGASPYPPYNIERTGENAYRVTIAVAGFSEADLSIESKENTLTVKGEKQPKPDDGNAEVLYQGIAARAFERVFRLADFVEVKSAVLENGLLHIDLVREIPEAMKPRNIRINSGKVVDTKAVDTKAAA